MQQSLRDPSAKSRELASPTVHEAPMDARDWRFWARSLGIAALAGVFLATIGAYGVERGLVSRLLYWVPAMVVASAIGMIVLIYGMRLATRAAIWLRLRPLLFLGLITVMMTPPVTLWVFAYSRAFFGVSVAHVTLLDYAPGVLTISAAMSALYYLIYRPATETHARPDGRSPRFLERLPPKLKGAVLYAVEAEDHYLRLHTSKGADLILMRLSDAIAELEGVEGAQTHRSWWVAKAAVQTVKREGAKASLVLINGVEAPISRANLRPLREAGWL